jgi:hypothetical protein
MKPDFDGRVPRLDRRPTHGLPRDGGTDRGGKSPQEGMRMAETGAQLRHEERREEERMIREFDDANLTVVVEARRLEAGALERRKILGVQPVTAAIGLDHRRGPVERGGPAVRHDGDRLVQAHQGAGQLGDDKPVGAGADLAVVGILEPKDVARELEDRVLEATSGADQRHAAFASEADGGEGALEVSVGTCRGDQEAGIDGQPLVASLRGHVHGRYPLAAKADVGQRRVGGLMRRVLCIEVPNDPYEDAWRLTGGHIAFLRSGLG